MKILILGGTQFIGRHIVSALLLAGHEVTIFARGQTKDELPVSVERLRGDRDAGSQGLTALAGRSWDACVDVSGYTPRQVRASAAQLCGSVRRYVFISAVSVYGDPAARPVRETDPLLPAADEQVIEVNGETYGPLKVTCESIVRQIFGERCTVLRPQIVVGPYDPSGRYAYWIHRVAKGGQLLAPGDGSDHMQVIDVRDLARFAVKVLEDDVSGVFNLVGPRIAWSAFLNLLGAKDLVWVSAEVLASAGLTFVELPLYRPEHGARASLMDVSSERAEAAGLRLTAPEVTARDTRDWLREAGLGIDQGIDIGVDVIPGLSAEREAELIDRCRKSGAAV